MAFIFYDTETTGVLTNFDQILQFGAIKTDDDLNELHRFDIRCRLMPHIVPSPGALRVTGVTPAMLSDPSLPSHYEAVCQIRAKLLEWSPAVFMGYNSISFDEELLRQALFQNLHPPYLTNTGGNARADVMRLVQAAAVYAPEALTIPIARNNRQTLRLDRLAPANGFEHEAAHEAVSDVEATIHIARLIKDRAPEVWSRLSSLCRKEDVVRAACVDEPLALTEFYYGREFTYPVVHCGSNPDYEAQIGVFDLRNDPADYVNLSDRELDEAMNASPKVIRIVRANAQPILMPLASLPGKSRAHFPPIEVIHSRAEIVRSNQAFHDKVGEALARRIADRTPAVHFEQRIYDGFPGKADEQLMRDFHEASGWGQRADIASRLQDDRLKHFAYRVVYEESPEVLIAEHRLQIEGWLSKRIMGEDEQAPWTTLPKAILEADDLAQNAVGGEALLMIDIRNFIEDLGSKWSSQR